MGLAQLLLILLRICDDIQYFVKYMIFINISANNKFIYKIFKFFRKICKTFYHNNVSPVCLKTVNTTDPSGAFPESITLLSRFLVKYGNLVNAVVADSSVTTTHAPISVEHEIPDENVATSTSASIVRRSWG